MNFTKMHGLGNDYVLVNCFREKIQEPSELAKKISDRHFGIGSDGLILVKPSEKADFKMEIYNADGSAAKMCGNGIRCLAKYVYECGMTAKTVLTVETVSGIRTLILLIEEGTVGQICVDMGTPRLNAHSIPILCERDIVYKEPITVDGISYRMTGISMGNPHAVVYVDDVKSYPVEKTGPAFEFHPRFPERINVEFCQVLDRRTIALRIWERGAGETLACGTGACAACVAGVLNDLTDEKVTVKLLGGELSVRWDRQVNHVYLTGPAVRVFDGIL
ncbi:MAG: diaminopimelate epimerase [Bariatricus sp.]|nr:diaminopimelate epimerase [Bariatricus sp.]